MEEENNVVPESTNEAVISETENAEIVGEEKVVEEGTYESTATEGDGTGV